VATTELTSHTILPARREDIELRTADGLTLVGELALPQAQTQARVQDRVGARGQAQGDPSVATLILLHPLPTHGGSMDSHVYRKIDWRLPALANVAVLRFNTRGTTSTRGQSEGQFNGGVGERHDVAAAIEFAKQRGLPDIWLVGWSFGTELALKYGCVPDVQGAILLAPPLHRATDADLDVWAADGKPLTALVPEFDDYLRPDEARERFTRVPQAEVIGVDTAKHLWVGERYVRIVLNEIVRKVNPAAVLLPVAWDGPFEKYAANLDTRAPAEPGGSSVCAR
jgi:uncharacterized protein